MPATVGPVTTSSRSLAALGTTAEGAHAAAPASADSRDDAKLRGAARQLTGLFAQQLFKAMRDTVPQDEGVVSGGSGEEMFTGMLDEHLAGTDARAGAPGGGAAGDAGAAFTRGLADAVYRRLRVHAGVGADTPGSSAAPPTPAAGLPLAAPHPTGLPVTPAPAAASLPVRPSSALTGLR